MASRSHLRMLEWVDRVKNTYLVAEAVTRPCSDRPWMFQGGRPESPGLDLESDHRQRLVAFGSMKLGSGFRSKGPQHQEAIGYWWPSLSHDMVSKVTKVRSGIGSKPQLPRSRRGLEARYLREAGEVLKN